jgi:hypothetical protein
MVGCGGSSGTSTLATWANVSDVVNGNNGGKGCFGPDCHVTGDHEPYMIGIGSVPLADADLYRKLTTYKTTTCGARQLVKPCSPNDSAFYLAQAGTGTMGMCDGIVRMPLGCDPAYDQCTPDDMLEGIRQWIANGAPGP